MGFTGGGTGRREGDEGSPVFTFSPWEGAKGAGRGGRGQVRGRVVAGDLTRMDGHGRTWTDMDGTDQHGRAWTNTDGKGGRGGSRQTVRAALCLKFPGR